MFVYICLFIYLYKYIIAVHWRHYVTSRIKKLKFYFIIMKICIPYYLLLSALNYKAILASIYASCLSSIVYSSFWNYDVHLIVEIWILKEKSYGLLLYKGNEYLSEKRGERSGRTEGFTLWDGVTHFQLKTSIHITH